MKFIEMTPEQLLAIFYIFGNVVSMIIMLILYIKNRKNKQTAAFLLMLIILFLIIYFIGDSIWALAYFNIIPGADIVIKFARMIYYSASGAIACAWLLYVELLLGSKLVYSKKRRLLYIPVLLSTISTILLCIFLNPAEKSIGGYMTAFGLVFVPFAYIITAGVRLLYKAHEAKDIITKRKLYTFGTLPILILAISSLQVFIAEIPIFCFGSIIVIITLYIYNQDSLIFTDPLTGVGNRNSLKKYVDDMSKEHIYYILMADIDSFKKINDTYGHIEGDRALRFTARILRTSTIHNSYYVARYGGDEFMIIARTENENDIISTIDLINTKMKESKNELNYEITTSIGYSVLNKGESIEAAVERADNMLYEKKKIVHK